MLGAVCREEITLGTITSRYGYGHEVVMNDVSLERMKSLCELPGIKRAELAGLPFLLCHGSPWDSDEYVYPDAP